MEKSDEKLYLKWNEFQDNLFTAFGNLKEDNDFTDVTLVCEDGQQFDAHKLVLISSSPFFFDVLKRINHPHPLIFMAGLKSTFLMTMMEFLYKGEVKIDQNQLEPFLSLAEQLQLKDFRGSKAEEEDSKPQSLKRRKTIKPIPTESPVSDAPFGDQAPIELEVKDVRPKQSSNQDQLMRSEPFPVLENYSYSTEDGFEELDKKVKSMFEFSENPAPGNCLGRARICKVCGKEGERTSIINHIEANHLPGISIPCKICGKDFTSRHAFKQHNRSKHK